MSLLQNEDNITEQNQNERSMYELPAVIRHEKEDERFEKALIFSLILHPALVVIILLTSLILRFLGINFDLFKKPDIRPKDIEYVLVDKEGTPIDKNTKNRADKNSRAGGINDPNRPVSMPQAPSPKPDKKPAAPAQQQAPAKKPSAPQQPKVQQPQKTVQQPAQQKPAPKAEQPAPKAPAPKPTPAPAAPKVTQKPTSSFTIPVPKSSIPQVAQPTAPLTPAPQIGGGGSTTGVKGGTGTAPAPTFSQSKSTSSGSGSGGGSGRFSGTSGSGSGGNVGNPGPGNPKGAPGIDAIKEPDFGPYMKELQRRIKMNWDPPKGNESKRVILLFSISKDGRLMSVKVHKSSGLPAADNAAINAVKLTAPFRPLPPEFKGNSVDIQFTFDYNVLGASMY